MKHRLLLLALLSATALAQPLTIPQWEQASIEVKLDQTLQAYNRTCWQDFFQHFATVSSDLLSQRGFQTVYRDGVFARFGAYKDRTLLPEQSKGQGVVALLIYRADFEKQPARISANLLKESGQWKIQQLRIDPET